MDSVAKKAASLWADKLRDGFSHDAGDARLNSDLARATLLAIADQDLSLEDIDTFEKLLQEGIAQDLLTGGQVFLIVDYEPKDLLRKVVLECPGLNVLGRFPVKSRMWVCRDRITYSFGYGQDFQEWRPK